jgi:hypothetical protein
MRLGSATLLLFIAGLWLTAQGSATAQQVPDAPHSYWDTPNKVLLLSHAGLEAADFAITHRNLAAGGIEVDPMAKALCQSGTAGQLVFFGGRMAAVTGISYALHRFGLHKAERAFIVHASGDSAWGLGYSLKHR